VVDIFWEGIPNWGTLLAAIAAGLFAWRAAHWTKEAAHWTKQQSEAADQQVIEARRSYDLLLRSQLDGLAPVVYARATPGVSGGIPEVKPFEYLVIGSPEHSTEWTEVTRRVDLRTSGNEPQVQAAVFRSNITLYLKNVSTHIALIAVTEEAGGEIQGMTGTELVLSPGEDKTLTWSRTLNSVLELARQGSETQPECSRFYVAFQVRDLGGNVTDTYRFDADLGYITRSGDYLIAQPSAPNPWTQQVATIEGDRTYDRLDWAETPPEIEPPPTS
jgi:hypothetical protein